MTLTIFNKDGIQKFECTGFNFKLGKLLIFNKDDVKIIEGVVRMWV